jgi:hypothetical protein
MIIVSAGVLMQHDCEFCGCKVDKDAFTIIDKPAFGVYVCGKMECIEQLAVFVGDIQVACQKGK